MEKEIKAATIALFAIIKKIQEGKEIATFSEEDWKDIANSVYEYVAKLPESEYSIFIFEMYTKYIRCSVEQFQALSLLGKDQAVLISGVADDLEKKTELFRSGCMEEVQYIEDCLWISLDAMFKLLSAVCMKSIKIEELSEFGIALSDFAFEYGRLRLYRKEQADYATYIEEQHKLDSELEHKYGTYVEKLKKQDKIFSALLDNAFERDYRVSFLKSMLLAQAIGVEEDQLLRNKEDIDDYFLN